MSRRKQLKFEDLTSEILFKSMKEAFQNSKSYSYEAELMYRLRSYGHSSAFSILGIEELGKSIGYYLLYNKKQINLPGRIDFNPNHLLKDIQTIHKSKQSLAMVFSLIHQLSLIDLNILKQEIDKQTQKLSYNSKKHKLIHNLQDLKSKINKIRNWQSELEYIDKMNSKKMNGFYVEIKNRPLRISSPKKVKSKDAMCELKLLNKYINIFEVAF